MRLSLSFSLVIALTSAAPSSAHAHGRAPALGQIAFHPTNDDVILVRGTFGLIATDDGGATFHWICPTAYGGRWTEDPAVTVAADGSFIVGVFDGLARGTNGGCDWASPSMDLTDEVVIDVARTADASRLFALQSSGGAVNGLWTSTDSGATWSATNPAIDAILFETVRVAPSDAMRVYLTGAYPPSVDMPRRPFVYASADGGMTFDAVAFDDFRDGDNNVYLLGVDPLDPDRLLIHVSAMADDRIYESTDGGATFTEIFTLPTLGGFAWSEDGSTVWIGSRVGGIHRSTDGGRTFALLRDDISVTCLGVRGDELFVCGGVSALGRSTDEGVTIDPLFALADIGGIVECDSGADALTVCASELPDLERDLGILRDAGVTDAGADSSVPDAGLGDGGTDAGAGDDSGTETDSGRRDVFRPPEDDGCSCRVPGPERRGSKGGWLALGAFLLIAYRLGRKSRRNGEPRSLRRRRP